MGNLPLMLPTARILVALCGIVLLTTGCFGIPVENDSTDSDPKDATTASGAATENSDATPDPLISVLAQSAQSDEFEDVVPKKHLETWGLDKNGEENLQVKGFSCQKNVRYNFGKYWFYLHPSPCITSAWHAWKDHKGHFQRACQKFGVGWMLSGNFGQHHSVHDCGGGGWGNTRLQACCVFFVKKPAVPTAAPSAVRLKRMWVSQIPIFACAQKFSKCETSKSISVGTTTEDFSSRTLEKYANVWQTEMSMEGGMKGIGQVEASAEARGEFESNLQSQFISCMHATQKKHTKMSSAKCTSVRDDWIDGVRHTKYSKCFGYQGSTTIELTSGKRIILNGEFIAVYDHALTPEAMFAQVYPKVQGSVKLGVLAPSTSGGDADDDDAGGDDDDDENGSGDDEEPGSAPTRATGSKPTRAPSRSTGSKPTRSPTRSKPTRKRRRRSKTTRKRRRRSKTTRRRRKSPRRRRI